MIEVDISENDDDLREVKYQFHSLPIRFLYLRVWPKVNYFWLHITYITTVILVGGLIIWKLEEGRPTYAKGERPPLSYIDATLSAATAVSSTGMGTLDFWALSTGSMVTHMILTQLGSVVFVGAITAFIRWRSLKRWLHKHPSRKYRDNDKLMICGKSLFRLGLVLVIFNLISIIAGGIILSTYCYLELNEEINSNGANPVWFAFFTVICGFNQAGFAMIRDGLVPFNHDIVFVIVLSIVMLISNALLPFVLRNIISFVRKYSRDPEPWQFLLDHPRICSTSMFPAVQTKYLTIVVFLYLGLQMLSFSLLDYDYPVMDGMSGWHQFVVTIFQATNTIQAGFPVVHVNETNPAQQWCYFIYMLVAVYPYISVLRNTEVISENRDFFHPDSLLKESQRQSDFQKRMHSASSMQKANLVMDQSVYHLKRAFLGDAFWLIFAVFLICVFDGKKTETDTEYLFISIYIAVSSAYGGVGLTLGYATVDGGFAQIFSQLSKVVMVGVLILGRHREMPRRHDVAVMQVQLLVKTPDPPSNMHSVEG